MKILHLCFVVISLVFVVKCDIDDAVLSNIKCLVCKATILEMENEIQKIDPRKRVEVSGFRLDADGKSKSKSIQYSKSETYLTELMESICEDDNFSTVRKSILQKIIVTEMLNNNGALDFTPDGDLSKSLNHFCLEVLEENEEVILKNFMEEIPPQHIEDIVCTKMAHYCDADEGGDSTDRNEL